MPASEWRRSAEAPRGAEVVIVGGGVTGLSAGWWLALEGVAVVVVEKGVLGAEASGRNGGGCSHHHSPLFAEEQRLWPNLDELLGYPTEFRPNRIRVALGERQRTLYERGARNARRQGFRVDDMSVAEVRAAVPLAGDNAVSGHFYHFGGHANPQRTVEAYARAFEDHGGTLLERTAVTAILTRGGRVMAVETTAGPIGCDHLVLAAGPGIGALATSIGIDVPLALARAEMIVTEPVPAMPVGGVDGNGLYGRQTLRGNLAYGGGPHEWLDDPDGDGATAKPTSPLSRNIAGRLAELLPGASRYRVIRTWSGVVENTPDGRPVIERMADPANVTLATLSGVGFGLSPASGRAIAELVRTGRCTFADLSTLSLSRFARLEPDWRERQGWRVPSPGDGAHPASARSAA